MPMTLEEARKKARELMKGHTFSFIVDTWDFPNTKTHPVTDDVLFRFFSPSPYFIDEKAVTLEKLLEQVEDKVKLSKIPNNPAGYRPSKSSNL